MPEQTTQPANRRHRSRRHSARLRRRRAVLTLAAASAVLAAAVWIAVTAGPKESLDPRPAVSTLADDVFATAEERLVYKYSVVPGGLYSSDELQRALADPVVAAHYAKVDRANIRTETVPADRYVHVSYRKGDKIFWSTKKVLLKKGETILTDGTTQIRSRCGNCISEEALAPAAADEPDVVEFDRLVDSTDPRAATPETAYVNMADPSSAGLAGAAGAPGLAGAGSSMLVGGGAAALGGGGAGGSGVPLVGATPSGNREPGNPPDSFAGDPPTPGNPWVAELDLPFPGGTGLPTLDELLPPGPDQPNGPDDFVPTPPSPPTGNEPVNPVPVPEPGTFMLLGGGVAVLVRRLRSRTRQS